jgi:hypothetical protein
MPYQIPHNFVLQALFPLRPTIKKMLGAYGVFLHNRMIMFLRDSESELEFNGVFIATQPEYFQQLQQEIHLSKMQFDLDGSIDSWIFISEDLDDFKEKVIKACEMVKNNDDRIGKYVR